MDKPRFLHSLVLDLDDLLVLDGLSQLPQAVKDFLVVVRGNIVQLLVGNERADGFLAGFRNRAVDQLVQNWQHFIPPHGAAFQQDFADGKDLAVCQPLRCGLYQPIAAQLGVIDHVLFQVPFGKKTAQVLNVTLNASLRDMKILCQISFFQNGSFVQAGVDFQQTSGFNTGLLHDTLLNHVPQNT